MQIGNKGTFVLFNIGHDESMLRLGDLVLYNYKDPLNVCHYTCQNSPDGSAASSTRISKLSVFNKHGPRTGIELEAANFIKLGVTVDQSVGKLVIAESAERVVLRSPSTYLRDVVLADKSAREALTIWLSAGSTERILKFKWARRPKIWMMTGMYLFDKAKVVTVRSKSLGAEIGISSDIITALTTVPVGGSIDSSVSSSAEISMEVLDRKVWAAQYQLLNARCIKAATLAETEAITTLTLYPDIISRGLLRTSNLSTRVSALIEAFDPTEEAIDEDVTSIRYHRGGVSGGIRDNNRVIPKRAEGRCVKRRRLR